MDIGIRFSSPTLDSNDYKNIAKALNLKHEELESMIEYAPYEISILVSLLQKVTEKI